MSEAGKLKRLSAGALSRLYVIYRAAFDSRVRWHVRLLILLILAYVLSPVDLIPDFIPVLGLLDEAILVPIGVKLVFSLLPQRILEEYERDQAERRIGKSLIAAGIALVITIWLLIIAFAAALIR